MSRLASGILTLALACAACEQRLDGLLPSPATDGPKVVFDVTARPLPEIPFPNDLATRLDPDAPTGRRVNASMAAPTLLESRVREEFDLLDGWGTFAPITVSFDAPIDPVAVRARHAELESRFEDDAVYLINLDTGMPVHLDLGRGNFPVLNEGKPTSYWENDPRGLGSNLLFETYDEDLNGNGVLDEGEDTDGDGVLDRPNTVDPSKPMHGVDPDDLAPAGEEGNDVFRDLLEFYERESNTLLIRPVVPLEQQTTYAVVLTRRIVDPQGRAIGSPFPFVNHVSQTQQLAPLLGHIDEGRVPGLKRDDVVFAWAFTTQTTTRDLEAIRDGLHGQGTLAWLADQFPPKLEKVAFLPGVAEEPEVDLPLHPLVSDAHAKAKNGGNRFILKAESLRNFVEQFSDQMGLGSGPEADSILDAYAFVDYIVVGSYRSPDFMDDPARPTTDAVFRVNAKEGTARVWKRPENWQDIQLDALDAEVRVALDAPEKKRQARFALRDRITFILVVPKAINGHQAPFPVTLHAHGANSAREEAIAFGGHFAKFGIATISINGFAHGLDVDSITKAAIGGVLKSEGLEPFAQALFTGRARDLDLDGVEDTGGDFWVYDTFHARDAVRQSIVDWLQLVRVLQSFGSWELGDLDGDGKPERAGDFNADGVIDVGGPAFNPDGSPSKGAELYMEGISMGGIMTGVAAALEPSIRAAVAISAGGGLGDIAGRTDLNQVTRNVFVDVFGSLFVTRPVEGGVDLYELVGGVQKLEQVKLNAAPLDVREGDRLEIVNLNADLDEGGVDSMRVPASLRVRLQVGADRARYLDDSPYSADDVRAGACEPESVRVSEAARLKLDRHADCMRLNVYRKDGSGAEKLVSSWTAFDGALTFRGRTVPEGSPFVALGGGFGFKRQTKTFRRFLTLAQTILEPADPVNYAPHYFGRPLAARTGKPVALLMIPTLGDMGVPINTAFSMGRASGVFPYVYDPQRDSERGMSPNDVAIKVKAMEAVEKLRYYAPVASHLREPAAPIAAKDQAIVDLVTCEQPEICEKPAIVDLFNVAWDGERFLDNTTSYMQGNGGAPRLKKPLRPEELTKSYPSVDAWGKPFEAVTSLVGVYPDAEGRHVFDLPNPSSDFDIGLMVLNMTGSFLASGGTQVHTEICLHRDGYTGWRRTEGAVRDPACDFIPDYPAEE